ncbi:GNAT family N-acetyltransferase [Desulfobaculum bizertense]|uniref:Putative acetyltransferase n=1 Tax=Desulfobaculum bizertense DSM 18034 TaxID=1121442 RepID=A0A1T4VX12_9BACT|nr:GNAT family N-acetyltransferase [Desulfobaculum bizertense]UIJ36850.1 GNAT family N-acetyltransferase [Desulfobaculum bizertense]SKA69536.1 putative acetyltransferase [Desulfobaculum bizertense DSM 18034]
MNLYSIRPATEQDYDSIIDVWEASVRASHDFLSEEDISYLRPLIRDQYLAAVTLHVMCFAKSRIVGFLGTHGQSVEMLFLHPEHWRKGLGRQLMEFAIKECGARLVDVNEQNPKAAAFYTALGFELESRDELDGQGRPFPILHLRLKDSQR